MKNIIDRRGLLAFLIINVVVLTAAGMIYTFRDAPVSLPIGGANSDGKGGALVSWRDEDGQRFQRLNATGQPVWPEGGVFLEAPDGGSWSSQPDGLGGAILTSNLPFDMENNDPRPFYIQRINADGEFVWGDSASIPSFKGERSQIVSDGAGGAIIAWDDFRTVYRGLHDSSLRVQKIAPDGSLLWGDDGRLVVTSSPYHALTPEEQVAGVKGLYTRSNPTYGGMHRIVPDGEGGAFIIWQEQGGKEPDRVYVQRVNAQGNYIWPDEVLTAAAELFSAESDGQGGVLIEDSGSVSTRFGSVSPLAHLDKDGKALADRQGVAANTVADGSGGVFYLRVEERLTLPHISHFTCYMQRFDAEDQPVWPEMLLFPEDAGVGRFKYIADGNGGMVLTFERQAKGFPYEIMAMKIGGDGSRVWGDEGVPVFDNLSMKYQGSVITYSDSNGGVVVVALLGKGGLSGDMVYVQHLDAGGNRLLGNGIRLN